MEDYIKSKLNVKTLKKLSSASGCINRGNAYETEKGKYFIKFNNGSEAESMFRGEQESLKELSKTKTIKVPEPILVDKTNKEYFIVLEYLNIKSLSKYSSALGESLAKLHLHNIQNPTVQKFGFHTPTSCGYLLQSNQWFEDWASFYATTKIQPQVNMLLESDGCRELSELWSRLQIEIPSFFKGVEIKPSLLHGDLWIGNAGETETEPVVYDPASFYGHHEYDLAIAAMFGGFGKGFFDAYHKLIPKTEGFEQRHKLYLLFHHLNHWNHFGSHKSSSLSIMKDLLKRTRL